MIWHSEGCAYRYGGDCSCGATTWPEDEEPIGCDNLRLTARPSASGKETEMINASIRMESLKRDIAEAASQITELWWTNPAENGHIKAQVVREIIEKHILGHVDNEL